MRITLLAAAVLGALVSVQAMAHEPRVIGGDCNVEVGWQTEPALEDADNFAVIIIEDCGGTPVAASDIHLTVKALRLKSAAYNAQILNQASLGSMNAIDGFASVQITPSVDGAYGFVIDGTIAGRNINNEKFVCGGGSLAAGEAFDCVVNQKVFPGPAINRYVPN